LTSDLDRARRGKQKAQDRRQEAEEEFREAQKRLADTGAKRQVVDELAQRLEVRSRQRAQDRLDEELAERQLGGRTLGKES